MGEQHDSTSPVILFYSYAHEDEPLRGQLEKHLRLLSRHGLISEWYDRQIVAGTEWAQEIDEHLETASIILLLISADFLASDYCYDIEMKRALERHQRGEARVIPIILRPCDWRTSPFAHLQCLPRDGKAVTTWQNPDEAFLTIAQGLRLIIERQQIPARPLSHVERQKRTQLMKRVRDAWIEGVLEHSLHQAALIALDLQEQPDALDNPWRLEVQETNLPPRPLPAGTRITQVYDEAKGDLLILGEPGSGKTTLLLELARDLLDRAEQAESHPMPVVFILPSWAEKPQQPLTDWLTEELKLKYQVSPQLAKSWLATDHILPLLDGLDEVSQAHRVDCLKAINAYRSEHDLVSLVVCSRSKEYFSQTTRIQLRNAVTLQPLTVQQIDEYLVSAGEQLTALHTVLHHDAVLLSLASTPLMLSVMTLTYHGKAIEDLTTSGPPELRRRQIFAAYVQRMFERRGVVAHYTPQQTSGWLEWLASRMAQHHQPDFYLESLQPDWLWEKRLRRYYDWTVGRPLACVLYALLRAVYSGLLAIPVVILVSSTAVGISKEVLGALLGIFPGGVLISLVGGILHGWRKGLYTAAVGIPTGALFGALISRVISGPDRPTMGLIVGLVTGGMIGLLASIIGGEGYSGIFTAPVFGWSWEEVRLSFKRVNKNLRVASVLGGVSSILVGAVVSVEKGVFSGLGTGGVMLLAGLLLFVLYSGVESKSLSKHERIEPNQGIWLAARKGLYVCLAVGSCAFISTWLIISNVAGMALGWICALIAGFLFGIIQGWFSDWNACVRHLVLRVLLWRAGSIPRNYAYFLDYAVERIFLRKIGGGYTFIHRQLLEYFALQENETERALLVKPDAKDATIYHNLGEIYAEFGDYDQAIMNYTLAIELDPKEVSVYRDRGVAYAEHKEYQQAIADYTSAIDLEPKNGWTCRQRGIVYNELEKYKEAIADFSQAIKLEPERALTYRYRGWSYQDNEEYEKASVDFSQAIKLAPQEAWRYENRGQIYFELKEYEKAIADLSTAIELDPQEAWFYRDRGLVYVELKEYEKAIADLNRSVELQPSDASLYDSRGFAYLRMKAYEQTIEDCTHAIELDATYKRAYFHRGYAYLWLKESKLAHDDFVQYAALLPKSINAAWMVIYSNLNKQRPRSEVIETLEKMVAIKPQSGSARFCQGVALGLQNNYSDGIVQLEHAIQLGKFTRDAYFWKGLFYAYLGQGAEATQAIMQALGAELPPVLLTPLYWLEQEQPEMYQTVAISLLVKNDI